MRFFFSTLLIALVLLSSYSVRAEGELRNSQYATLPSPVPVPDVPKVSDNVPTSGCVPQTAHLIPSYTWPKPAASYVTRTPPLTLPAVNVHNRQTVPMSKRMAEIQVKLPDDVKVWVTVNSVEYPPESSFRRFRTSLRTYEARSYEISARYRADNKWVYLKAAHSRAAPAPIDADTYVVSVSPAETVRIRFYRQ